MLLKLSCDWLAACTRVSEVQRVDCCCSRDDVVPGAVTGCGGPYVLMNGLAVKKPDNL